MSRRTIAGSSTALVFLVSCAPGNTAGPADGPDRHAYVWAMAADSTGRDGLLVLDMDSASAGYGQVIGEVMLDTGGTMPHHIERRVHDGVLFASSWRANRTWIIDVGDPARPVIRTSFGSVDSVAGWAHDYARLPNGNMLVAYNAGPGAYAGSGGLGEVDDSGRVLQVVSALMPGVGDTAATPYVVHPVPGRDRAVVGLTEMGMSSTDTFHQVNLLQLWSTAPLAPLAPIPMPSDGAGHSNIWSSSIERTGSGELYTNTFSCGLFRITGLDGDAPTAERVFTFPGGGTGLECGVGVTVGDRWIQAVSALPGLVVVDLSDPAQGREVSQLVMDSTAYAGVHWVSVNGDGTRLAVTGSGGWLAMVRFDPATGTIAFDERFGTRDDGNPGRVMHDMEGRPMHPHGVAWGR